MKLKFSMLAALLLAISTGAFAQTNTFPATGNVGIGTLTPAEKLSVVTPTATWGVTQSDGTIKVGMYAGSGGGYYGTVSNHPLFFRTNNGAAQVTLLQNGRMGIGTTAPTGRLDVRVEDSYFQLVRAGLGNGNDTTNTCFGRNALSKNRPDSGGRLNTAIGFNTLNANVKGYNNVAVGANALEKNYSGSLNVAVGRQALTSNTTGINNVAIGTFGLYYNTTGGFNVAVGNYALVNNQTGIENCALGDQSLEENTTGQMNIAVGSGASRNNTTGKNNVALGQWALLFNTTGDGNVAVGKEAAWSSTGASENTAIGYLALDSNVTGTQNTAAGTHALFYNKGNWNTGFGRYALYNNRTGADNTAVGDVALYYNNTGSNNTGVGYFATPSTSALSNTSAFGYNTRTTASNQVRLGNSSVTSIGGYTDWTNISDGRVKKNIKENVPGLAFINQLKPVTYNLNLAEADKIISAGPAPEKDRKDELKMQEAARAEKEKVLYTGFIAQDVEKAAQSLSYDFSGVDAPKNDKDIYGLRYASFVVPLVKSVQELSKLNEEKDAAINELKQQVNEFQQKARDFQQQIDDLRILMIGRKENGNENVSTKKTTISSASLEQNIPNPFNNSTAIGYTLPLNYTVAKVIITDVKGKTIKEVNVSGSGKGAVNINTVSLSAGTYQYSLYVNEGLVDTRQMVLSR